MDFRVDCSQEIVRINWTGPMSDEFYIFYNCSDLPVRNLPANLHTLGCFLYMYTASFLMNWSRKLQNFPLSLFVVRMSLSNCHCQRPTMGDQLKFRSTIMVFVPMVDVFPILVVAASSNGKTSLQ